MTYPFFARFSSVASRTGASTCCRRRNPTSSGSSPEGGVRIGASPGERRPLGSRPRRAQRPIIAATTPRNVKVAVATGDSREILAIPKRTSSTFGKSTMTRYEVKGARFVSSNVRSVRPPDCEIRTGFGEYASCATSMPAGRTTSTVSLHLEYRSGMARIDTDHRQAKLFELAPQPCDRRSCLKADPYRSRCLRSHECSDRLRLGIDYALSHD